MSAKDLLASYDAWREERADLSATEEGAIPAPAGDWHNSDDTGCGLADALATELTQVVHLARQALQDGLTIDPVDLLEHLGYPEAG